MAVSQGLGVGRSDASVPETGAGERLPSTISNELRTLRLVRDDLDDAIEDQEEEDGEQRSRYLRGEFGANLCDPRDIEDPVRLDDLKRIATELRRGIEADLKSRKDWEEMANRAIRFLGLIYEEAQSEPSASDGSISRAWATLMLEAALGFWANAYAEFLPADGPVKVRDDMPAAAGIGHNGGPQLNDGGDPGQSVEQLPSISGDQTQSSDGQDGGMDRAALADAFELTYNHYLLVGDKQYYRDFSRMLWSLGPKGTEFRKVYVNPLRKMPVSEWVKSDNLIVSNEAGDISTAQRITERMPSFLHADVKRLQYMKWWRQCSFMTPSSQPTSMQKTAGQVEGINPAIDYPADHPHTFMEVYCQRDLEGFEHEDEDGRTGLPLPYRFTMEWDSNEIVEIRRNWKEGDEDFKARQRYVMFGLVPGFGLYYLGFAHLLGNTERAATALTREMIDANMMSIFPGWLAEKGSLPKGTTQVRVGPMGVVEVDTQLKKSVRDAFEPLPVKPLDPQSLALLTKLEQNGRNVSGKLELPQGEGTQNIPVGTMIAIVEQGTKVMMAVHKGLHASRAEELELLRELIAEDPSVLSRFAKIAAAKREWVAEEFQDLDLVPSSDPNTPSHVHRLMRGIGLAQLKAMFPELMVPRVTKNLYDSLLRILQVQAPTEFSPTEEELAQMASQPQPNPQAIQAQVKQGIAQLQAQMKQMEIASREKTEAAKVQGDKEQALIDQQTERIKTAGQVQVAQQRDRAQLHGQLLDHAHERVLEGQRQQHEAALSAQDQQHEAMQNEQQRLHDAAQSQQDREQASLSQPTPKRQF